MIDEVNNGVKLLDSKIPGWRDRIELGYLDMSRGENCIVGQLFEGKYSHGLIELGIHNHSEEYGFDLYGKEADKWEAYEELEELWENAILDGKV